MKRRLLLWFLLLAAAVGVVQGQDTVTLRDTVLLLRTDTVFLIRTDTVKVRVVDSSMLRNVQEREALMAEKEKFYKEIFTKSGVDQNKIEADRDHYRHLVDSLNQLVRTAELENVRKEEANKYLLQRAKDAEARVAEATNRKKKVRAIQGIAMRFLWDLTQYFNKDHKSVKIGETNIKTPELRKFDQDFAYDVGIYVGFGGSNLFKNFYVGPSFRFVDFFYFTVGVNIAEYNVLVSGYDEGSVLKSETIDDVTAKSWLLKPFLALSIDLDFLSYIKK